MVGSLEEEWKTWTNKVEELSEVEEWKSSHLLWEEAKSRKRQLLAEANSAACWATNQSNQEVCAETAGGTNVREADSI